MTVSAVVCCFAKREAMCDSPSTSLTKHSPPVGVVPAPAWQAAICHLELACSEAVLADFAAEAFIPLLCLLMCIQVNMLIYILDVSLETTDFRGFRVAKILGSLFN